MPHSHDHHIAIIGLGYVGLPLAVEFGKRYPTIGFDIDAGRIEELRAGRDHTRETSPEDLASAPRLRFSCDAADLAGCTTFVVTVPTPVDAEKRPDFTPLVRASETVGKVLKRGDIVIYESTVYPGATEEICAPVLERHSGLAMNRDFTLGYSPERINPGDPHRRLVNIPKVTSGSTPETARIVDALYQSILSVPTHLAPSIKVAEAAKVIENTQRDANIALINEFALIFHKLGIDTGDVLAAAGTKWNFLPFRPGLVGGHCIGVDPYYLIQKAQAVGYHPSILLACRRINDAMGQHVAGEVLKLMLQRRIDVARARLLVLGMTFKENCPDIRNTRVVDLVREFGDYMIDVDVFDPWADPDEVKREYGLDILRQEPEAGTYDAIVVAVAHTEFVERGIAHVRALGRPHAIVYDIKSCFDRPLVDGRL